MKRLRFDSLLDLDSRRGRTLRKKVVTFFFTTYYLVIVNRALIVGSGVTYGGREDVLFYWFQKAWECEKVLPILGRGNNVIPLINVIDLAQLV